MDTKQKTTRNPAGQRLGHVAAEINALRMIYNSQQAEQQRREAHLALALERLAAVQREAVMLIADLRLTCAEHTVTIEQLRNQIDTLLERVEVSVESTDAYIISGTDAFSLLRATVEANCAPAHQQRSV